MTLKDTELSPAAKAALAALPQPMKIEEPDEKKEYKVDSDPIYKETAFARQVYVYEDSQKRLSPQTLVLIVMNMFKKEIKIQKQKIWAESLKKREKLRAKRQTDKQKAAGLLTSLDDNLNDISI